MTPRDSYRSRVLAAEAGVTWQQMDGKEVRALLLRVKRSKWWAANFVSIPTATGFHYRSLPCADTTDTTSLFYGHAAPALRLMHALAHYMTAYEAESSAHGPEFARSYLVITRRFLGQDAYDALKVSFAAHKVKCRTWSAGAKQAAKERSAVRELRAMREDLSK